MHNPVARLIAVFLSWKIILILFAAFSPGPGYDTSSLILLAPSKDRNVHYQSLTSVDRLLLKLFRWDALYFVKAAERGYVHEQEWAFSWAYSRILSFAVRSSSSSDHVPLLHYIRAGVIISVLCHLASVIILYRLLNLAVNHRKSKDIAFIASTLHVMSPAGLFLCSSYTEAPFSFFNFLGMLFYAQARRIEKHDNSWGLLQDTLILASGASFGAATLMRSNGLLSGLIFLFDAFCLLSHVLTFQLQAREARRLTITCIAGSLLALGFITPQVLAYKEYCVTSGLDPGARPWCSDRLPSIYSFVQTHYWNVGFLRYWTLSNLPLFCLAAPMLWLLFESSVTTLRDIERSTIRKTRPGSSDVSVKPKDTDAPFCIFPQLALPQLVLAVMAFTSFHVQIVNRLSSGYPIWYLMVAKWISDSEAEDISIGQIAKTAPRWTSRGLVMYSIVQGMLFASFLPPA
ncbi:GPI mannosyltransferase 2 [Lophiotrema nucula]|uniref:GPI mannosyltransferase 2 n=1 Tax=Lophiotrema nucula TaxID=690887 RepID=A0A6A5Z9U5_9PLEO|nr:GPI mannosyltransferase 2 [Lophiotrema nucula]